MAKLGEINYLRNHGEAAVRHAMHKPFSDVNCPKYLVEIGTVMSLLPPPPARILDIGCGAGWTSVFFAKAGYHVVGVDIAPDMIFHADQVRRKEGLDNLQFQVCDYEEMSFQDEFDGAVFFDSLHHAVDEEAAVRMAFRALKPQGVCVTSEPGQGHKDTPIAVEAVRKYNVTEKDMPPEKIVAMGREAGFRRHWIFPYAFDLNHLIFSTTKEGPYQRPIRKRRWFKRLFHWLLIGRLGLGSRLFSTKTTELYWFRNLAHFFNRVHLNGGIVVLEK